MSRAIDALELKRSISAYVLCEDGKRIFDIIDEQPTIEPERKTGRWMPYEDEDGEHYGDTCSVCGEWYVMPFGETNFCPNCGAYMGEKGEEL